MATWTVLFRGINVGGKNTLPMVDLIRTLNDAGLADVTTYIQSGNVVFRHPARAPGPLAALIGEAVERNHGFRPDLMLLNTTELAAAAAGNPYPNAQIDPKALHLYFLSAAPALTNVRAAERLKSPTESCTVVGKVLYLHAPDGIGRSKFAGGVEKALGVSATARNWRTVSKLLDMAREAR